MGNAQLAGDHAGPDSGGGHFDDLAADVVGQGSAVDEDAAELIDASLSWKEMRGASVRECCVAWKGSSRLSVLEVRGSY